MIYYTERKSLSIIYHQYRWKMKLCCSDKKQPQKINRRKTFSVSAIFYLSLLANLSSMKMAFFQIFKREPKSRLGRLLRSILYGMLQNLNCGKWFIEHFKSLKRMLVLIQTPILDLLEVCRTKKRSRYSRGSP